MNVPRLQGAASAAALGILAAALASAQIPTPTLATARGFYYPGATVPDLGHVTAGTSGFTLRATGTGFVAPSVAAGTAVVWIPGGGAACPGQTCVIPATVSSSTLLEAAIPPDLLLTADANARVALINPNSPQSNSLSFPVNPPMAQVATLPPATVGVFYSAPLVTGGSQPFNFFFEVGAFPPGLSATSTGLLTGVPTIANVYTFDPVVDDAWTYLFSFYTLTVNPAASLSFTPTALAGDAGAPFNQTLTGSGGTAPYIFTGLSGLLPAGLTLSSSGLISGTPQLAGTYAIQIGVTDAASGSGSATLTLTIRPTISPATLPNGQVGIAYSQTLSGGGGTAPYTFALGTSGSLPAGLSMTSAGVISGTPTTSGTSTFTVLVSDASQTAGSRILSITIGSTPTFTPSTLPGGQVTLAYSQTLSGANGVSPYTFSLVGNLPPGLTLSTTGVIGGTPTTQGAYTFQVQVTDAASASGAAPLSISIAAPPSFSPTNLVGGVVGVAYSQTLSGAGGTAPYTFSHVSGAMPGGLTLTSAGVFSGVPTTAGSYSFLVRVADANGAFGTGSVDMVVTGATAVSFTPLTLPPAQPGAAYSQTLTGTGGTAPYTFTIVSGNPPGGITLSQAGVLSGIPTAQGAFTFTVQVRDAAQVSGTAALTLTVAVPASISFSPASLPAATLGVIYSAVLVGTGGTGPYRFSLQSGAPIGLTLATNGVLSGIPVQSGNFNFLVQATDATGASGIGNVSLVVRAALQIVTASLPPAVLEEPYTAQFTATGGLPPYTWTLAGALPPGLVFTPNGVINGTPQGPGGGPVFVTVRDSNGFAATRTFDLVLFIPPPAISSLSLPNATVSTPYSFTFTATGGSGTLTWQVVSGSMPPGLSLSPQGTVSGTPTTAGDYSFDVRVTDSGGRAGLGTARLHVNPPPLSITTGPLPPLAGGQVSIQFAATGGTPPYNWSLGGGSLPMGLSLSAGGLLGGRTTDVGTFDFRVVATDSRGTAAARNYSLQLTGLPLRITTTALPRGAISQPYSATVAAEGGRPPYQWTADGLPQGLGMAGGTGAISGTPGVDGTFRVASRVTDSAGTGAAAELELIIDPPPLAITESSLAEGTAGTNYSASFKATGGRLPYNWQVASGFVPGLTLSGSGVLSGVPATAGEYTLSILVSDARGVSARVETTLTVRAAPLSIVTRSLPGGTVGQRYSQTVAAAGGAPPYTWSAVLPAGLSIDPATGVVSGVPTAAGPANLQATVADTTRHSVSAAFTVTFTLPTLPAFSVSGLPDSMEPLRQSPIRLSMAGTYPVAISGTATLTFRGDTGVDDPAVQFSSAGRSAPFTVAAGSTEAVFAAPNLALQSGTVAGVITLTLRLQAGGVDATPSPAPTRQVRVNSTAPVLTSVRATRTASGIEVQLVGYSSTREAAQAVFRFTPVPGGTLQAGDVTMAVESVFSTWYNSASSLDFGGQFSFTQTFNLQGTSAIQSVAATLSNRLGASNTMTANLQ